MNILFELFLPNEISYGAGRHFYPVAELSGSQVLFHDLSLCIRQIYFGVEKSSLNSKLR